MKKATCALSFILACMLLFAGCAASDNAGVSLSATPEPSQAAVSAPAEAQDTFPSQEPSPAPESDPASALRPGKPGNSSPFQTGLETHLGASSVSLT